MSQTKISLSPEELRLAANASVILTKNAIMEKTKQLLNRIQDKQESYLTSLPEFEFPVIQHSNPKISKGENYLGLPYLVLDYPRIFEKNATAAIRTMFWWGNFFSVTLHLSGKYKMGTENELLNAYEILRKRGYYCCVNDTEWAHHFEPDNYQPLKKLGYNDFEKIVQEKPFAKIAYKFPLEDWNDAEETCYGIFAELVRIMADQAPRR
jgi:hypothetical protein